MSIAILSQIWQHQEIMDVVDRRQELFENVLRLRRVGRDVPGNPDVAAVRVTLESELGETVSRRMAARLLGVSHTALERWIRAGELPVVSSVAGRVEVPVPALLDLVESVRVDRADGPRRHPLAPTMARHREAAGRLRIERREPTGEDVGHDRAAARSLAYHRAVAQRLRRPMVDEARHVLFRWRRQGRIDERYADRWDQLLARPLAEIRRAMVAESSDADDLRQTSPFAGMLSEAERRRIIDEVR
jgi:hypothetical protein